MAKANAPDWTLLPEGILIDIVRRFKTLRDFFAVRGVCCSWRSAATPSPYTLSSQSPLLLLSTLSYPCSLSQAIYDVATRRPYSFRLPWTATSYSHGHIITFHDPNIVLSDLFTGAQVRLPNHPLYAAAKVLISARPDPAGSCRVVLFRSYLDDKMVRYLNVGDDSWTVASSPHELLDMMFCRGELFALSKDLDLLRVELTGDSLTVWKLGDGGSTRARNHVGFWLGELDGVMMLVIRKFVEGVGLGRGIFRSQEFDVFRWNLELEKWEEVWDLGGDLSVFVSMYGNAVSFPVTGLGLRTNCVYSANDQRGEWDGFSLKDRSWEKVNIVDANLPKSRTYLAIWIFPNHC